MAWEARGQRRYFYRSQRAADGRVVKVYLGNSPAAREAAAEIAAAREARRLAAAALGKIDAELQALDDPSSEFMAGVQLLAEAALFAAGYHRPKRIWRKRRD